MTIRDIAKVLLHYIGVTSFDPAANANADNQRGLGDNDLSDVVICINAALQEIYHVGPPALTQQVVSDILRPPTTITFTAAQYAKTMTSVSGYATWMNGCTIRVSGDNQDNRLVNTLAGDGTAVTLQNPYTGASGAVTATVYCDAITLPSTVSAVVEPVTLPNRAPLLLAESRERFETFYSPTIRHDRYPHDIGAFSYQPRSAGAPTVGFAEAEYNSGNTAVTMFLRVYPMPDTAYPIFFKAKRKAPTVTAANIDGNDHATDPNVVLPMEIVESTLLPFALQRWTAHPSFSRPEATPEIARQYQVAKQSLMRHRPQVSLDAAMFADQS